MQSVPVRLRRDAARCMLHGVDQPSPAGDPKWQLDPRTVPADLGDGQSGTLFVRPAQKVERYLDWCTRCGLAPADRLVGVVASLGDHLLLVGDRTAEAVAGLRTLLAGVEDNRRELNARQHVADYTGVRAQRGYTHMYTGKHVGLYRALRARLRNVLDPSRPLVSVGAGPMLDLIGWTLDAPWRGPIVTADPLDWSSITDLPAHRAVLETLGLRRGAMLAHTWAPGGPLPPQLAELSAPVRRRLTPLPAAGIPRGAVVLMPFVGNHFLDEWGRPHMPSFQRLARWQRDLVDRGCAVVMADLADDRTDLWHALRRSLPTTGATRSFSYAAAVHPLASIYPEHHSSYRGYLRNPHGCTARVLACTGAGWHFMSAEAR